MPRCPSTIAASEESVSTVTLLIVQFIICFIKKWSINCYLISVQTNGTMIRRSCTGVNDSCEGLGPEIGSRWIECINCRTDFCNESSDLVFENPVKMVLLLIVFLSLTLF